MDLQQLSDALSDHIDETSRNLKALSDRLRLIEQRLDSAPEPQQGVDRSKTCVDDDEMPKLKEKLGELLDKDSGLSTWVIEFIERLSKWGRNFTKVQASKLEQIWEEVINGE